AERARDRRQVGGRGDPITLAQAPDRAVPRRKGTQRIDPQGRDERRRPGDRTGRHGKEVKTWSSAEVVRQATWWSRSSRRERKAGHGVERRGQRSETTAAAFEAGSPRRQSGCSRSSRRL